MAVSLSCPGRGPQRAENSGCFRQQGRPGFLHLCRQRFDAPTIINDYGRIPRPSLVRGLGSDPGLRLRAAEAVAPHQPFAGDIERSAHDPYFVEEVLPAGFDEHGCLEDDDAAVATVA